MICVGADELPVLRYRMLLLDQSILVRPMRLAESTLRGGRMSEIGTLLSEEGWSGWNDALDAMIDRLSSASESLEESANAKCSRPGKPLPGMASDYDRLRGQRMGVRLALDFARGMKHQR